MRTTVIVACVVAFFLMVPGVFASLTLNQGSLSFGSSSQEKFLSNGTSPTLKQSLSVTADKSYTNLRFELTPSNCFSQDKLVLPSLTTINAGQTLTFDVGVIIPPCFDAVDDNFEQSDFTIGTLTIKGDNAIESGTTTDQSSTTLGLEVKNQLTLDKIELEKEDGSTVEISVGSTIEVTADQDLQFTFFIKNTFGNDTADFDEITIDMEVKDNGDDSVSLTSLDAAEVDSESIEFNFDDIGNKKVTLQVKGTDEFGGVHGFEKEFNLNIKEAPEEPDDTDGDGVPDPSDSCPNTPTYCGVGSNGCPYDKDNDGICNDVDSVDDSVQETQEEETQQTSQTTSTQPQLKTQEKFVPAPKSDSAASHFLPFVLGFISGGVIAAGFMFLLRS
jgi:hypothetical protein